MKKIFNKKPLIFLLFLVFISIISYSNYQKTVKLEEEILNLKNETSMVNSEISRFLHTLSFKKLQFAEMFNQVAAADNISLAIVADGIIDILLEPDYSSVINIIVPLHFEEGDYILFNGMSIPRKALDHHLGRLKEELSFNEMTHLEEPLFIVEIHTGNGNPVPEFVNKILQDIFSKIQKAGFSRVSIKTY